MPFIYQSAGTGEITYIDQDNLDHTLKFVTQRTNVGEQKDVPLIRGRSVEELIKYVNGAACTTGCKTKTTRSFNLGISTVALQSESERDAFIADLNLFVANIQTAIRNGWLSGSLPRADQEFATTPSEG